MKDVLTIQRADHLTAAQATAMAVHQAEATAHLKAEVMPLQREGAMDIHQKDAATATPTEGAAMETPTEGAAMETPTGEAVMAARTEEAATADHLKAEATEIPREDPMVHLQKEEASVRQAEEHLTAHQRAEVSVRQAEGLSQVKAEVQKEEAADRQENRSADVTTEPEEADSRAADLQEEAQLHAETDVEWMPKEPRPNRIHTNSTILTSRI